MTINHSEIRTDRDSIEEEPLQQLTSEARRLRVELAGDHTAQLVVGLDLLIRRTAYRLIAVCRGLVEHATAAFHGGHGDRSPCAGTPRRSREVARRVRPL